MLYKKRNKWCYTDDNDKLYKFNTIEEAAEFLIGVPIDWPEEADRREAQEETVYARRAEDIADEIADETSE